MQKNRIPKLPYQNFKMLHPDGTLMCLINEKRANYYINKGLADWVENKTFRLKFEPKGRGKANISFYEQDIENKCVVCGDTSNLSKHHVVPYVFRSRFPVEHKESNHHDILVTCVECHHNYEELADEFKSKLAQKVGERIYSSMTPEHRHNKNIVSAKSVLEKIHLGIFDGKSVPKERLEELRRVANLKPYPIREFGSTIWADKIVESFINEDRLFDFIKMWRQHFIDYANPQYLPLHWSVDTPMENSVNIDMA
jgi:hypothetical protein